MGSETEHVAMDRKGVYSLIGSVQNYDWGISGASGSKVARLYEKNTGLVVEQEKKYAEFWMGTHPSGPSFVLREEGKVMLKEFIEENSCKVLGQKVFDTWGNDLPFLFKVLSVAKTLSIQAHPDKELATELHKMHPNIYKDANHKPEMAVAISEFEALCGFVSTKELKVVLDCVPEIRELVGEVEVNKYMEINEQCSFDEAKAHLQSIFTELMSADKEIVSKFVLKLKNRLIEESKIRLLSEKEKLALLLEEQYPGDIGVLSSFFFNDVKLKPGEALYLDANEPHAYISGECIECMATSDNVVRAGLTSKYRDVETLCRMLTYKQGCPDILRGTPLSKYVLRYTPPFYEFEVDTISLPTGESMQFDAISGPSIFVVTSGNGKLSENVEINEGSVFLLRANTELIISAHSDGTLQLYRAGVNSKFLD
nr:mannose-6-phosphate isomerase 1-like protein [Allium cepa]